MLAATGLPEFVMGTPALRPAPFNPGEYSSYGKAGTGRISGQAFTKTRGGDVKFAAGNVVLLTPKTTTSRAWLEYAASSGFDPDLLGPRVWRYTLKTIADGNGNFTFRKVGPGTYYVVTYVAWQYGVREREGVEVILATQVTVQRGAKLDNIILEPIGSREGPLGNR